MLADAASIPDIALAVDGPVKSSRGAAAIAKLSNLWTGWATKHDWYVSPRFALPGRTPFGLRAIARALETHIRIDLA